MTLRYSVVAGLQVMKEDIEINCLVGMRGILYLHPVSKKARDSSSRLK